MFKINKANNSDENTERKLYAKTFLKVFGLGFVSSVTNLSQEVVILAGSAALHREDLANGEFGTTLKTAVLANVGAGVLCGVASGLKSNEYIKNVVANTITDDESEVEVEFEKED